MIQLQPIYSSRDPPRRMRMVGKMAVARSPVSAPTPRYLRGQGSGLVRRKLSGRVGQCSKGRNQGCRRHLWEGVRSMHQCPSACGDGMQG